MRTRLKNGGGTYEVLAGNEALLEFTDTDTAIRFLRSICADPTTMQQLRHYLGERHPNLHMRSDHQIIALMASTMVDSKVRLLRTATASRAARNSRLPEVTEGTIPQQAAPVAAAPAPPPVVADDAAELDQDVQAEALEQAAIEGVPFCEECEKKKRERERQLAAAA